MGWLTALISAGGSAIKSFFEKRQEVKKAKHEKELELIRSTSDWETMMARASSTSWKDEWFTIVLSLPVVCIIYAISFDDMDMIQRVHEGFAALGALPEWYQVLLYIAVLASFGIKGTDKLFKLLKAK